MFWLRCTQGSVSVYFMIILSALFLFGSVFVDFIRIHTADLRMQTALQAATRSMQSAYEPKIQVYGLYGLQPRQAEDVFHQVLAENLSTEGVLSQRGSWVTLKWDETDLNWEYPYYLAEHAVFKQQILEEMKYRAPIEYMLGVYDKVSNTPALEMVQQASTVSKKLKKLEDIVQKRERKLDSAWSQITNLVGSLGYIQNVHSENEQALGQIDQLAKQLQEQSVASIEASKQRVQAEIASIAEELAQLLRQDHEEKIAAQQERLEKQRKEKEAWLTQLENLLQTALKYIEMIGKHKLTIELQGFHLASRQERINSHLREARQWNDQLRKEIETLDEEFHDAVPIIDPAYFDQLETGVASVVSIHHAYHLQFLPAELITGTDYAVRHPNLQRMNQAMLQEATQFYQRHHGAEEERQQQKQAVKQRQEEESGRAKGILDQAVSAITACSDGNEWTYARLQELEAQYVQYNEDLQAEQSEAMELTTDPEQASTRAMSFLEQLQGALLAVRDQAYVNEYALTKFNYRTMMSADYELSKPMNHSLVRQEAEYILYGLPSCHLNQGAAYAEMFLFRLSIRTMEALMKPNRSIVSAAASPWLVFLWAVAEGAIKAYQDMQQLLKGEEVELSARLPNRISLNYKDYLRLFMILHGNETRMMIRMQALVHLNSGIDLTTAATSIEASTRGRLSLWFIPEAVHVLGRSVQQGQVEIAASTSIQY